MPLTYEPMLDFAVWVLEQQQLAVPPFDQHVDNSHTNSTSVITPSDWSYWFDAVCLSARLGEKPVNQPFVNISQEWLQTENLDNYGLDSPESVATQLRDSLRSNHQRIVENNRYNDVDLFALAILKDRFDVSEESAINLLWETPTLCFPSEQALTQIQRLYREYASTKSLKKYTNIQAPDGVDGFLVNYTPIKEKPHPEKIMDVATYDVLPKMGIYAWLGKLKDLGLHGS